MHGINKSCESTYISDVSQNNMSPPWCSGKVYETRRPRKVPWEIRSSYPLRQNIWEYLHEGEGRAGKRKRRKCDCTQERKGVKRKTALVLLALLLIACGLMAIWYDLSLATLGPKIAVPAKILSKERLLSLCTSHESIKYISGVLVAKGANTDEYRGMVALWGVVPLWETAASPDTVLALRPATPGDCWPFVGAIGEVSMELAGYTRVQYLSIEHIRPDANRSAPKHFVLYGILQNGTTVTAVEDEYKYRGPGKQYFRTKLNGPLKQLVFKVLSNQGNSKYTCLYRVHIYEL